MTDIAQRMQAIALSCHGDPGPCACNGGKGRDIVHMEIGEPDFVTPQPSSTPESHHFATV